MFLEKNLDLNLAPIKIHSKMTQKFAMSVEKPKMTTTNVATKNVAKITINITKFYDKKTFSYSLTHKNLHTHYKKLIAW